MVVVCLPEEHRGRSTHPTSFLQRSASHRASQGTTVSSTSAQDLPTKQCIESHHLVNMAEFGDSENGEVSPNREIYRSDDGRGSAYPPQSAARARRKLGRGDSKSWFNKSFDQAVLASKPKPQKAIRRQNSVTDFFQSMLTKSKSHLHDIFASKKEKTNRTKQASSLQMSFDHSSSDRSLVGAGAEVSSSSNEHLNKNMKGGSPYSSGSLFRGDAQVSPIRALHPPSDEHSVNLNPNQAVTTAGTLRRASVDTKRTHFPLSRSSNMDIFLSSKHTQHNRSLSHNTSRKPFASPVHVPQKPVMKRSSLSLSSERPDVFSGLETSLPISPIPAAIRRKQMAQSASLSPSKGHGPRTVVTLSSYESTDSAEDEGGRGDREGARRSVCSAPPGRLSTCWDGPTSPTLLQAGKRTLVKSNSDTLARLEHSSSAYLSASSPQLMYKALSDRGGLGDKSLTQFLLSGVKSVGSVMIRVTDYLFLGSVEAAYNEPILCKYDISSLIDMTNVNPSHVPAHKKSDCPCACVANKTPHFRSKLNIGVDDIEWENLEQYFDEINSFINAARRKGRRVLVFSYMGQSRAAAAVVQHLMTHFKMPYQDAMKIVRSKRPQIKLNSGFVKALRRLEKRLGLAAAEESLLKERDGHAEELAIREGSPVVSRGSVEALEKQSPPHVVRDAWLDC